MALSWRNPVTQRPEFTICIRSMQQASDNHRKRRTMLCENTRSTDKVIYKGFSLRAQQGGEQAQREIVCCSNCIQLGWRIAQRKQLFVKLDICLCIGKCHTFSAALVSTCAPGATSSLLSCPGHRACSSLSNPPGVEYWNSSVIGTSTPYKSFTRLIMRMACNESPPAAKKSVSAVIS